MEQISNKQDMSTKYKARLRKSVHGSAQPTYTDRDQRCNHVVKRVGQSVKSTLWFQYTLKFV